MPEFLSVVAIEPEVDDFGTGDADRTLDTLLEQVEARCDDWEQPVRVLFTSPWEPDCYGLLVVEDGTIEQDFSSFSLEPQAMVATGATPGPHVRVSCDASEFADALAEASEGAEAEGDAFALPWAWTDVEQMVLVTRLIAPHLVEQQVSALVSVNGSPARLTLHREKGVTVEPVFAWFADEVGREMVQRLVTPIGAASGAPITGNAVAVLEDSLLEKGARLGATLGKRTEGSTPLTSGSAQSRVSKTWGATSEEMLAALDAPENEGERFEALRITLMESLQRQRPVPPTLLGVLLRRLPRESERARCSIYSLLTKHDDSAAYEALAAAFETDAACAALLASVVWRQRGTVDLLLKKLLKAWPGQQALAGRIISVFKAEYIAVHPDQIKGAPPELFVRLSSLVTR